MFLCCLFLEIYKNLTFTLYNGVCVGEVGGGNQGIARLVLTGCGIAVSKYSEPFAEIRDAAFKFVFLRPKVRISVPIIASNRFLSLIDANILFA